MPSHAPAKQQDAADDVEVYANGVAFDVVKGWLGRAGEDLEFDQWFGVEDVDADRPARQERLGLGAKFLSHEKASRLTGAVHKKLGKVLARSQRRRDEEEEEEERGAESAAAGGQKSGKNENVSGESDVDSDDGGRASVSFVGKRKAKAWDPTTDPMLMHARVGKKKKKKKATRDGGA